MENYPSVTKFMARNLITFTPEMDIREAINVMLRKKISGAPVLDKKKKMVGMLSEVDCLKILVEGPYNHEPSQHGTVADFMTPTAHTIDADKTILDAAYIFVHSGFKRLPVLENGDLIGQISRVDILKAIQKMGPKLDHIPDSWRGRVPSMANHKKSRYTENS